MNERFIRCSECGMPHEAGLRVCPTTGRAVGRAAPPVGPRPPPSAPAAPSPKQLSRPAALPKKAPSTPGSSADFELLGTLIGGKYRVRSVLGEGGMGTVFDALHEALGNLVAIKVLHPTQLHKKDAVRRFHHEARAAARIGHPNICEVYDVGSLVDGRPYLVMERLVGETLADRIATHGGLPFQEALDTLTQVLSGLHAAHETGIMHRDIKPENVFLTRRVGCLPIAKLLDFGVSKVMSQQSQPSGFSEMEVTRTGVVMGTPYYLAPEQARGERNLDARVDLYACGVMLYEALTGKRPFRAANYNALLIAILSGAPRPARELRHDLPKDFERVLDKSMHRDPGGRFQTALEFQAALHPYSENRAGARAGPAYARVSPPVAATRTIARPVPRPSSRPPVLEGFDDMATQVDLPRHNLPPSSRGVPRRSVPILGPPLRAPASTSLADETATEIMAIPILRSTAEAKADESSRPTTVKPPPVPPRPPRR